MEQLGNVDISELTGVGPKAKESYASLGISTVKDLVEFLPKGYEDHTSRITIGQQVPDGPWTNTYVTVLSKGFFGRGLKNIKATVEDTQSGVRGEVLGFNRPFLDKVLRVGEFYHLYANQMPQKGYSKPQYSQFQIQAVTEQQAYSCPPGGTMGELLPVYPLAGSLTQKAVRRDVRNALLRIQNIENDLPAYIMSRYKLMDRDSAIRKLHFPKTEEDIVQARRTLAFSEVFYLQLLALRRPSAASRRCVVKKIHPIEEKFIERLPFKLTDDQVTVLDEIRTDMSSNDAMNRLLQGDVGSGKTLVAWISALHAIAEGFQVAFMAPTELLARQHAQGAAKLFDGLGINTAYLDGQVKPKQRALLLQQLQNGSINLLIGTHALFSKDVQFRNLGYVIIDEQHRFGVEQRAALMQKGENPDILLMTATPIPRTLALTIYGNLNVSTIHTMPAGRLPIQTFTVDTNHRQAMYQAVGKELERGHQAYFVCPKIDATDPSNGDSQDIQPTLEVKDDLEDVYSMYNYLDQIYKGYKGAVIHSKIPDDEKVKILDDFASGKIRFLVATSVVEVGIDVPNATCMVIEHSENFGLSALHQLRGRVGRSTLQSWCFLAHDSDLTEDGKRRLSVLKRTCDGFEIAEEDLKIRGPGEITGLRQSGFNNLKYASLDKDLAMMAKARDEVKNILQNDPGLIEPQNAIIRIRLGELKPCLQ